MVGNKISDLFKSSHEIPVFALSRDNELLWNPDSEIQLRYDDVIICYGELNHLRSSLKNAILGIAEKSFNKAGKEESRAWAVLTNLNKSIERRVIMKSSQLLVLLVFSSLMFQYLPANHSHDDYSKISSYNDVRYNSEATQYEIEV